MRTAASAAIAVLLAGCVPAAIAPTPPAPAPAPAPFAPPPTQERVEQLPAPRPAWEARPVTPDARSVPAQEIIVRSGDTLGRIAERSGASLEAIARANAIAPPYALRAGQRLAIPGGRYHRVAPGQTGIAIARAYGVPWSQVVAANALTEPYLLKAGQRVLIPAPPASTAARAAAFTLDVDTILTGGEPAVASAGATKRPATGARRVLPATVPVTAPAAAPGRFIWPLAGRVVRRFGAGASGERFDGIEIAVAEGTPVKASAAGIAIAAGGLLRDAGGALARSGALGAGLEGPASGYLIVYHIEIALLFGALVALGPLVRSQAARPVPGPVTGRDRTRLTERPA